MDRIIDRMKFPGTVECRRHIVVMDPKLCSNVMMGEMKDVKRIGLRTEP